VVAIIAALFLIPAPFKVSVEATLTPVVQRDVFVNVAGEVIEVPVEHDQTVQQGQRVALLRNTELDQQYKQLSGERERALLTLQTLEFRKRRPESMRNAADATQLTIDLGQARQKYEHLSEQVALLEEKIARLEVASPITGMVVTWDVRENLMQRPVSPGQGLRTVIVPP